MYVLHGKGIACCPVDVNCVGSRYENGLVFGDCCFSNCSKDGCVMGVQLKQSVKPLGRFV